MIGFLWSFWSTIGTALGLGYLGNCLGPSTRERPQILGQKLKYIFFLKYFFLRYRKKKKKKKKNDYFYIFLPLLRGTKELSNVRDITILNILGLQYVSLITRNNLYRKIL